MKRSTCKNILILSVMLIALVSCSKDDDDIYIAPKTVNDINLTFNEIDTPPTPEDPGNYSVWFAMIGDKIYYMNPSNTPLSQFALEYNITSNSFSTKTTDAAICACGYSSKIITDGTDLFHIANEAMKYSPASDSWTDLNYPVEFEDNNGEAAVAYLNGKIYFFGGRTASTTFKYYEIATDSWHAAPDGPYVNTESELIAVNNTLYSLGGRSVDDQKNFSSYSETNGWSVLPNLPFDLSGYSTEHQTAVYDNRYIFAMTRNDIHIYDTIERIWKTDPINIPAFDIRYENIFINGNTLFMAGKTTSNEFTLIEINIAL